MYIDQVRKTDRVTLERLSNEALSWGISPGRASDIISALVDAVPAAVEAAQAETPGLPDLIPRIVATQLDRLRS
jgi:hypothetical protein